MIKLKGEHVLLTVEQYRYLLSLEKPAALTALEAADSHLRGHISNGDEFDDMAARVLEAASEFVAANQLMGEEVEHADSHSAAVAIYIAAARRWWQVEREAERIEGDAALPDDLARETVLASWGLHTQVIRRVLGASGGEGEDDSESAIHAAARVAGERDDANDGFRLLNGQHAAVMSALRAAFRLPTATIPQILEAIENVKDQIK